MNRSELSCSLIGEIVSVLLATVCLVFAIGMVAKTIELNSYANVAPTPLPTATPTPPPIIETVLDKVADPACPETMFFGHGVQELYGSDDSFCIYEVFSVPKEKASARRHYSGVGMPRKFAERAIVVDDTLRVDGSLDFYEIEPEIPIWQKAEYTNALNGQIYVVLYENLHNSSPESEDYWVPSFILFPDGTVSKLIIEHQWRVGVHKYDSLSRIIDTFQVEEDGVIYLWDVIPLVQGETISYGGRVWKYVKWDDVSAVVIEYSDPVPPRDVRTNI